MRTASILVLSVIALGVPHSASAASYRVVYYMQAYNQPGGLIEGSPGTFYSTATGPADVLFSITSTGTIAYLAMFNLNTTGILSVPVSAANNLFYSILGYTGGSTSYNVISVDSTPGSLRTYPTQSIPILMAQNLPDGALLGYNTAQLVKSGLGGAVSLIYEFPSGNRPYAPVYITDGSYYGLIGVSPDASGYAYKLTSSGALTTLYSSGFAAGTKRSATDSS
jgi:hypothetical protein